MSPTVQAALTDAVARLRAAGIASPRTDARHLMAHALGIAPGRVTLHLHDPLAAAPAARFEAALDDRAAHRPVAQITGRRSFWGRDFRVSGDVLDPRPETETLVAQALGASFARVLDLGTGSGCILLTLLAERGAATGMGTDISEAALAVARDNAARLGVAGRAGFAAGDWYAPVEGRFDLVVSNPPYIAAAEMAGLSPEVARWEPHGALSPGVDALAAYRAIAGGARAHLSPGGWLMVEIGAGQGAAVAAILRGAGLEGAACHPDMDGRDRVVAARAPR